MMNNDPRDNLNWEGALEEALLGLPVLKEGQTRLYRIEPQLRIEKAEWLEQALAQTNKGEGRWFTDDRSALLFYVKDQALAQPALVFMDVPSTQAEDWRVNNWKPLPTGEDPKRFSRDPNREYFLPSRDLRLDKEYVVSIEPTLLVPRRRFSF